MISNEIIITLSLTLMAGAIFIMYRYFNDLVEQAFSDICERTEILTGLMNKISDNWKRDIDFLDQRLKDGIQSNSICCKSAMDKLNHKIEALQPKKDTYEPKKPATKKPTPTD